MMNKPVAVLDSGIGGLPYLSWIQEHLPQETLIYLADRKNFPYGEKTPEQVQAAVHEAVRALVDRFDPKILVLACNTASVLALEDLRSHFSFPIIGVVPAVKTAAERTRNGRIGVLATKRTIEGEYLKRLIDAYCSDKAMFCLAASDIVHHVEEDYLNPNLENRRAILEGWAETLHRANVDTVVLGCTHFLHVTPEMQSALGENVLVVDSRDGVGRQTKKLLTDRGWLSERKIDVDRFFYSASPDWADLEAMDEKYRTFARRFDLDFSGSWTFER